MDRQYMARNIILFNVPEVSTSISNQQNCNEYIYDIFVNMNVSIKPISAHHLGKVSNKPRPIRVILPSTTDVFQILKTKRKLNSLQKLKNIRIYSGQTLQQRKQYSSVNAELK